jgi:LysR family glycine cleavage system transcriptional activator
MAANSRVPPFKSIEAFVTAAQTLSFTAAASVLHITVPAMSRRIQALENDLGVALFKRKHRALALTEAGKWYLANLEPAIAGIRRASQEVRRSACPHTVAVSLPASLAANWLLPRLPQFHCQHRGVRVELESADPRGAPGDGEIDIAIRFGSGKWSGLRAERLLDVEAFAVASRSLLSVESRSRSPDALARLPLLGIKGQPELWTEWLGKAGVEADVRVVQEFDTPDLLYRAAACGLGVALGIDILIQPYLESGQLIRLFGAQFSLDDGYYLVGRTGDIPRAPVVKFRDWLRRQAVHQSSQRTPPKRLDQHPQARPSLALHSAAISQK